MAVKVRRKWEYLVDDRLTKLFIEGDDVEETKYLNSMSSNGYVLVSASIGKMAIDDTDDPDVQALCTRYIWKRQVHNS
jgi:hypothetical protein